MLLKITLEVSLNLNGYPVRISDTAGIRESSDHIEKEGVELALYFFFLLLYFMKIFREQIKESNLNLLLLDINDVQLNLKEKSILPKDTEKFKKISEIATNEQTVILLNKSDTVNLPESCNLKEFSLIWNDKAYKIFEVISCKENQGVQNFENRLAEEVIFDFFSVIHLSISKIKREFLSDGNSKDTYSLITKSRHRIELEKCVEHLERFCRLNRSVKIFILIFYI